MFWILGVILVSLVVYVLYKQMDARDELQKRDVNSMNSMRYKYDRRDLQNRNHRR